MVGKQLEAVTASMTTATLYDSVVLLLLSQTRIMLSGGHVAVASMAQAVSTTKQALQRCGPIAPAT